MWLMINHRVLTKSDEDLHADRPPLGDFTEFAIYC